MVTYTIYGYRPTGIILDYARTRNPFLNNQPWKRASKKNKVR